MVQEQTELEEEEKENNVGESPAKKKRRSTQEAWTRLENHQLGTHCQSSHLDHIWALPKENSNRRRLLRRGSGFSIQSASLPPPPANICSRSTIFFFFFTAPAPNPQIFAVANVEISADTKSPISARLYPEILWAPQVFTDDASAMAQTKYKAAVLQMTKVVCCVVAAQSFFFFFFSRIFLSVVKPSSVFAKVSVWRLVAVDCEAQGEESCFSSQRFPSPVVGLQKQQIQILFAVLLPALDKLAILASWSLDHQLSSSAAFSTDMQLFQFWWACATELCNNKPIIPWYQLPCTTYQMQRQNVQGTVVHAQQR